MSNSVNPGLIENRIQQQKKNTDIVHTHTNKKVFTACPHLGQLAKHVCGGV